MMTLIKNYQIEKIAWQRLKPPIVFALQLLDIRNYNIRVFKVRAICSCTSNFYRLRIGRFSYHFALVIKHFRIARVEILLKLICNRKTRSHD
ncbi:hypothetical protein BK637_21320 [Pseudomonas chlororaphis]|nr:hypothetical protein BK637_21320 [Pseudomonas chlororaphis]